MVLRAAFDWTLVETVGVGQSEILVAGGWDRMPASLIAAFWQRPALIEHETEPALAPDDPSWDHYSVWRVGEPEEEETE